MDIDYLVGRLEIRYTNGEADTEMIKARGGRIGESRSPGRVREVETLGKAACDGEVEGKVHEEVLRLKT